MFDVKGFKEYGKLSRQDLEQLQAGARIEINEIKKIQWISCFGKCRKKTNQAGHPLGALVVQVGILNVLVNELQTAANILIFTVVVLI